MLDRQKVQLTSIMWREPSALGPDIIATYEGDTLSVRCPDGGLVVASLRSQPFKYAAVARESPDMTSLDSAPCHECNPTTIWRVRGLKLTNGLIRSEEHPSELQSQMRIAYAVFSLKKNTQKKNT